MARYPAGLRLPHLIAASFNSKKSLFGLSSGLQSRMLFVLGDLEHITKGLLFKKCPSTFVGLASKSFQVLCLHQKMLCISVAFWGCLCIWTYSTGTQTKSSGTQNGYVPLVYYSLLHFFKQHSLSCSCQAFLVLTEKKKKSASHCLVSVVARWGVPLLNLFILYIFQTLTSHIVFMSRCTVFREIRLLIIFETFFFFFLSLIFLLIEWCLPALPLFSIVGKQNQTTTGLLCM